jgi:hypothetical protein
LENFPSKAKPEFLSFPQAQKERISKQAQKDRQNACPFDL